MERRVDLGSRETLLVNDEAKNLLRIHLRTGIKPAGGHDRGSRSRCTQAPRCGLARNLYEDALNRMQDRVTPEAMRLRRSTVEHPFATIKYRIFEHPCLLMRGLPVHEPKSASFRQPEH
jgi:hypothetical protein